MGRNYTGDIEGKFWFAVQSSDDAEQFGAEGSEPNIIEYYADDLEACETRIREIFAELDIEPNFDMTQEAIWELADGSNFYDHNTPEHKRQELCASLDLGLMIYRCIKENGSCSFEAEC